MTKSKIVGKSLWMRIYDARWSYLFIAPLIIGVMAFCYYPAIYGLGLSFFEKSSSKGASFIGLQNFVELFQDQIFLQSIPTMFKIMLPKLIISIVMPLVMAELIFSLKSEKLQGITRILTLLPVVAPGVVGMLIWRNLLGAEGIFTVVCRILGVVDDATSINWLYDQNTVILAVILIGFPWIGGTSTLIYMSGLLNISSQVIEASRIDGATTFKRIFAIDIPLIVGQIRYFLIFGIIGSFQDYGIQFTLTNGGPGYSTYVPGWYMYKLAFTDDRMGYASSVSTVIFLAILIVTAICFKYMNIPGLHNDRSEEL